MKYNAIVRKTNYESPLDRWYTLARHAEEATKFMTDHIEHLLQELTLEEKVTMLAGADNWHTVPIKRLGIPAIKMTDGPNGVRGADSSLGPTSASFPVGIAVAATWNLDLTRQLGEALAQETRSKKAHILLAPTVNIHRSPLAGRNFECFSEDPHLSGRLATALIQGLQSQGVGACIKHFVCNDSEYERQSMSSEVAERPLHEIYLTPFRMAIRDAKPWAAMSAYNKLNGEWCSESDYLLQTILKETFGFDGIVISDWGGAHTVSGRPMAGLIWRCQAQLAGWDTTCQRPCALALLDQGLSMTRFAAYCASSREPVLPNRSNLNQKKPLIGQSTANSRVRLRGRRLCC
jgi:beta-glucosidase-like glycosyl hydrolase